MKAITISIAVEPEHQPGLQLERKILQYLFV